MKSALEVDFCEEDRKVFSLRYVRNDENNADKIWGLQISHFHYSSENWSKFEEKNELKVLAWKKILKWLFSDILIL